MMRKNTDTRNLIKYEKSRNMYMSRPSVFKDFLKRFFAFRTKNIAPGEDRTHDLKIMRLTRCLLRYRGIGEALQQHI